MSKIAQLTLSLSALLLVSCSAVSQESSVCEVRASPASFLGKDLELSGLAEVHRHGTNLTDPNCPGIALALSSPPESSQGSASDTFFLTLSPLMAPGSTPVAVKVHGKLIEQTGLPPYTFVVASGSIQRKGGG